MKCYNCKSKNIKKFLNSVRDVKDLSVFVCKECELYFLESFDHITEEFYENSSMKNREFNSDNISDDDRRRYEFLQERLFNKDVLDVGAGEGGFLKLAKEKAGSVCAVEPDFKSKELFDALKIKRFSKISDIPSNDKFDIITLFHVLEHLKDPIKELKILSKYLNNEGVIYAEFPN